MAKKKTIGEQIKSALDGRTQRWLSQKTGITEYRLSNKLNGLENFTDDEVQSIETILNISLIQKIS